MSDENPTINHIAAIIDGVVQQMLAVDNRVAAILLSNPTFVDATLPDGKPRAKYLDEYNSASDSFYTPVPTQPYPSWTLNEEKNMWEPPVQYPAYDPENPKAYSWNEDSLNWVEVSF